MIVQHPSPNFNDRPEGVAIDTLVLHYTGMKSAEAALERMCDPAAEVSAHYMIDEDGVVTQLVDEEKRAWHAGVSHWRGNDNLNHNSIGIELVNPGHEFGYRPFPEVQMQALIPLCQAILERHHIPAHHVVGHSDIAPDRKEDPGELFDWERLAEQGIGLFMPTNGNNNVLLQKGEQGKAVLDLQNHLAFFGYAIDRNGDFDEQTAQVVTAFKRHFCPLHLEPDWTKANQVCLEGLLEAVEDGS